MIDFRLIWLDHTTYIPASKFARIQVDSCQIKFATHYINGGESNDACKMICKNLKSILTFCLKINMNKENFINFINLINIFGNTGFSRKIICENLNIFLQLFYPLFQMTNSKMSQNVWKMSKFIHV